MNHLEILTILFLSVFAASQEVYGDTCSHPVDPKKIVLFLDLNISLPEVRAAERAACERGETVRVIPEGYELRYLKRRDFFQALENTEKICHIPPSSECSTLRKKSDALQEECRALEFKNLPELLDKELNQIKISGATVSALIISGHDGGGHFGGFYGGTSDAEIAGIFSKFPELKDGVQSLYLLGCYTAVPVSVLKWKGVFPDVKLLSGYDGSSPLSDKDAGLRCLEDLLKEEKKITGAANEKVISSELGSSIRDISEVNSAIYIQAPQCSQDGRFKEFYFKGRDTKGKPSLLPFSIDDCTEANAHLKENLELSQKYSTGELDIPLNTSNSPLRDLYTFFRKNEQCFGGSDSAAPTADQILFLLFFDNVKKDFARHFEKLIAEAGQVIEHLKLENVPIDSHIEIARAKKDFFIPTLENIRKKSRKEILADISALETLSQVSTNQKGGEKLTVLNGFMTDYLQNLQGLPFDWHEDVEHPSTP